MTSTYPYINLGPRSRWGRGARSRISTACASSLARSVRRSGVEETTDSKLPAAILDSEIDRQITLIESGGVVQQATRGFDAVSGETFHLRSKEDAPDYRYMPDPELGAIIISDVRGFLPSFHKAGALTCCFSQAQLAAARASLPELPAQAFDRLQSQYDLNSREAAILVSLGEGMDDTRPGSADVGVNYFELVAAGRDPKTAANWSARGFPDPTA